MENTDTTFLLLLRPLRCHRDKEGSVHQARATAKDNMMSNLYLSAHILTHVKLLFVSFPLKKRSIYKKELVLESALRNMINAPAGLSQDVAQ